MTPLSSWGRLGSHAHRQIFLNDRFAVATRIRSHLPGIAFGHGRSYGDVCLNPGGTLWKTRGLDRFISFDPLSGLLSCEAGVLLRDIHRLVVSEGWMLPVTPGTQLVTVGGAIANDVHGKNHHRYGSFGDHVEKLRLLRTDGEMIDCGPDQRSEWFSATLGGLGLTGLITEATIQLRNIEGAWLQSETIPYQSLEHFFELADASEEEWEHTVSWIDCMDKGQGRGLFMRANHIKSGFDEPKDRPLKMPFSPPISLINGLSLPPLNGGYYHLHRLKVKKAEVHYKPFFYPLDHVLEWNRIYGPKGFYQYQSVVPFEHGRAAIRAMLQAIAT
ncbi:MAG: FAD-binding oxidoreductase, partial [Gammaproteobacteria bacterium]|nr:FAD-binding oxidoreductase [Gammaproteobacteria bacterium]